LTSQIISWSGFDKILAIPWPTLSGKIYQLDNLIRLLLFSSRIKLPLERYKPTSFHVSHITTLSGNISNKGTIFYYTLLYTSVRPCGPYFIVVHQSPDEIALSIGKTVFLVIE